MTTPKGKLNKINRNAPISGAGHHLDNRGDFVFGDKELNKIRREGYDDRMQFKESTVKKKVKMAEGTKFIPVPVTKEKVSRRKWKILQEIRLRNSHD